MSAHVSHIKLYYSIKLQKGEASRRFEITVVQDNFIRCASVCFGVTVKGQYMEDLLGSLLLTTVSQNESKISPYGVEKCRS